jgi:hypothetical protein
MSRASRTRLVAAAVAVVVAAGLGACSDDGPNRGPQASASATDDGAQKTQELVDRIYASTDPAPAVASVSGHLPRVDWPVTAEIVSVRSSPTGTMLVWRLTASDGQEHRVASGGLAPEGSRLEYTDTRDVRLVDPSSQQYWQASMYTRLQDQLKPTYCLCSQLPTTISGQPVELSGEYPSLPSSVTHVDVHVPGVGVAKGVEVIRD